MTQAVGNPDEVLLSQGTSWWDRLYGARPSVAGPGDDTDALLWREAVDPDAAGLFERRISWDGWSEPDIPRLLGSPLPAETPWWWDDLEQMRAACRTAEPPDSARLDGVAFAEILQPLVTWNWSRLQAEVEPAALDPVTAPARARLQDALSAALSQICAPACAADFAAGRPVGRALLLRWGMATGTSSSQEYLAWCRTQLAEGLGGLLADHPVLGRLIALTAAHWRANTAEMLRRIAADRDRIAEAFAIPADAPICAVRGGLSDPHRGGRTVAVLGFGDPADTAWIVYKPKDLRIERKYHDLVSSIGRELPDGPHGLTVLTIGSDYGYESYVSHEPCPREHLPQFYRNAGRLLAILHFVGATDAHYENLIASGTSLHLIDAETLFQGRTAERPGTGDRRLGAEDGPLVASVLRVGLLPVWLIGGHRNVPYDISGLGVAPVNEPTPRPGWHNVGTDDIGWGLVPQPTSHPICLPVPPGDRNPLASHAEDVVAGFTEVYHLVRGRQFRAGIRNRITDFSGVSRRIVMRATRVYAQTQRAALSAESLTTGNRRGFELERLSRGSLIADGPSPHWQVFRAELHDMEQLDIPYFDHELGSDVIRSSLGPIAGILTSDGVAESIERIDRASDADLAWQVRLIRGAIAARHRTVNPPPTATQDTRESEVAQPADAQAIIDQVLESLSRSAVRDGRGRHTWLVLAAVAQSEAVQLGLLGDGLYDGRAGLAALLAAEPGRFPVTAQALLAPLLESLRDSDPYTRFRYVRDSGPGWSGVGGLLRLFEWISSLGTFGDDLVDDTVAQISADLIRRDHYLDHLGGVAGLIGPLARACVRCPDEHRLELLRAAAAHLAARQGVDGGWPSWLGPRPLTGLTHGASGMGLALIEAGRALDDDELVNAGARAFGYETGVFDETVGNWPDFRRMTTGSVPTFMTAWCHGAPGIGLARLRALELLPDHPEAGQWCAHLDSAMATTMRAPVAGPDHLCCGVIGRAAVLRIAGRARQTPEWLAASDAMTDSVCSRYADRGFFQLPLGDPTDRRLATPALMSGSAGIALHLSTRLRETDLRWLLLP